MDLILCTMAILVCFLVNHLKSGTELKYNCQQNCYACYLSTLLSLSRSLSLQKNSNMHLCDGIVMAVQYITAERVCIKYQ